jgi:NAD-dependent dihydropyrimidine dehydrogenase PreA subunit
LIKFGNAFINCQTKTRPKCGDRLDAICPIANYAGLNAGDPGLGHQPANLLWSSALVTRVRIPVAALLFLQFVVDGQNIYSITGLGYRLQLVDIAALDFKPKRIDDDFLSKTNEYPLTGTHEGHEVRAQGVQRNDASGKPYPTKLGIHGNSVAVDWEACIADGQCADVCPVNVFGWFLAGKGKVGSGNDVKIEKGSENWNKYRTDKMDPINEADCIFCMACETICPTVAIKITPK